MLHFFLFLSLRTFSKIQITGLKQQCFSLILIDSDYNRIVKRREERVQLIALNFSFVVYELLIKS